ncbi:MAG: S8 family serine peptidase [Sedimentisphaerales bacterium]|nr:S8 family serine peptidase [Sedimentisphaerales bacterium]
MERVLIGLTALLLVVELAAGNDEIMLKSRRFVPATGLDSALRSQTQVAESIRIQSASGAVHVIIQLETVPTAERRIELTNAGVQLLSYIPNRSWLAAVRTGKLADVAGLSGVRAVTAILPQDKLSPSIREQGINVYSRDIAGRARAVVLLFGDVGLETGEAAVEALGGEVIDRDSEQSCLICYLPIGALNALAAYDVVKWIDQHYESVDLNDGVRAAIHADPVQEAPYNLTGAGVVLGQWEPRHPDANHVDLAGRVVNIDDGRPVDDHATQVAGTMIGDGRLLESRLYRGIATAATVVSYRDWDNVADLRRQCREAIERYGIDLANNSWGKVEWNTYKEYDAALDGVVRGDLGKPISMVWAVGNEGTWSTIFSTAAAKNIVAVGATNSDDDSLWASSNKGPTQDGRVKPDVVAPGCETREGAAIWSTLPGNRYGGACGTSSAAPAVSGTMALIIEDCRNKYETDPLPCTIKALLLHTAQDLGTAGPDYAYGYGLIDARGAIDLLHGDPTDGEVLETMSVQQGEQQTFRLVVPSGAKRLKATLVWDDYPGDPLAAQALVNDLDLVVTGPDGKQYHPWTLDPSVPDKPAERTRADHTNNVEQVLVEEPAEGQWQVTVCGTTVPQPPQTYSLIVGSVGPAEEATSGHKNLSGDVRTCNGSFDDRRAYDTTDVVSDTNAWCVQREDGNCHG